MAEGQGGEEPPKTGFSAGSSAAEAPPSDATKNAVKTGAKAVATAYGGAVGGAAVDAISNTKIGQAALSKAGGIAEKLPGVKGASEKLNSSGALDMANKVMDAKGGGKGAAKGAAAKGANVPEGLKKKPPNMNANKGSASSDSKSASKGLEKKDGLEDGKKSSKSKNKGNNSGGGESSSETNSVDGEEISKKNSKAMKAALFVGSIFISFMGGIVLLMAPLLIMDTLFTSIVSLFGIKEAGVDESEEYALTTNDKYFKEENGEDDLGLNDWSSTEDGKHKGLLTILNEQNECNIGSNWFNFWDDIYAFFSEGRFSPEDTCQALRFIDTLSKDYEDKFSVYGLQIDRTMIYSTIFYGYDQQVLDIFKNDEQIERDGEYISASEHHETLKDLISGENPKLDRSSIKRMVRNSIFEDVWPYWTWKVNDAFADSVSGLDQHVTKKETYIYLDVKKQMVPYTSEEIKDNPSLTGTRKENAEELKDRISEEACAYIDNNVAPFFVDTKSIDIKNKNGGCDSIAEKLISGNGKAKIEIPIYYGTCVQREHTFYYYSLEKYKIFLRWDEYENKDNVDTPGTYSTAGYISNQNDSKYSIDVDNIEHTKINGSGWSYDTSMNNAWINSETPCNNTLTIEEILDEYILDATKNIKPTQKFFSERGYGNNSGLNRVVTTVQNVPYMQRIPQSELNTTTKDVFASSTRLHKKQSNLEVYDVKFSYNRGYAYLQFPAFKSSEDIALFAYNDITTPKKVETVITEIEDRKTEFDELLSPILTLRAEETHDKSKNNREAGDFDLENYCEEVVNYDLGRFEVKLYKANASDVNSNEDYITTRSFKDYIIGVTNAEVGVSGNAETIKAQMVAAISYTLGRRSFYKINGLNGSGNEKYEYVFSMKTASSDQNYCDPYIGCSRSDDGAYLNVSEDTGEEKLLLTTFPGVVNTSLSHGSTWYNNVLVDNKYWKGPLSEDQMKYASKLFEEAMLYVIYGPNDNGNEGFHGAYASGVQTRWQSDASNGYDFTEILAATYGEDHVKNCLEEATTKIRKVGEYVEGILDGSINGAACPAPDEKEDSSDIDKTGGDYVSTAFKYLGKSSSQVGLSGLWCAKFVSKVIRESSVNQKSIYHDGVPSFVTSCSADGGTFYHSDACCTSGTCGTVSGKTVSSINEAGGPKRNDVIVFATCKGNPEKSNYACDGNMPKNAEQGGGRHTGIVVKTDGTDVYYIHGNWGDKVAYHAVAKTSGYIVGYCRFGE